MRKRLLSLILSITLALSLIPEVLAADPTQMTDISEHWGYEHIVWAMEQGLFNGVTDTMFDPDGEMTRGMYVTVLGRLAGVDPADYNDWYLGNLYEDVSLESYYAPFVNWATRFGITKGVSDTQFSPDTPVTREQMATFMVRFASIYGYDIVCITDEVIDSFTDSGLVSEFASSAVESMRITGLIKGRQQPDGTYLFDPQSNATRAECATVFQRLHTSIQLSSAVALVPPMNLTVEPQTVTLDIGETTSLISTITPENVSNPTITWVSENRDVAKVSRDGKVTAVAEGTVEIYAYSWNGLVASCTVTCQRRLDLASGSESYEEKCDRIFGHYVSRSEYRDYYSSSAEAKSHMKTITIQCWDFTDSTQTEKYTRTFNLTVHENIADTVQAIFDEIYNGEEQFPIKAIGAYRWDYASEHTIGCAIDINPNENYYYNYKTGQQVGSYWKPYEDPYSIPTDGEVARIMNKYGFTQGIWSNSVDYMHFSYFGW